MKKQYLFLLFSIVLIFVGLFKSIRYVTIEDANGTSFEFGFEPDGPLLFGLVGLAIFYVTQKRKPGNE